MTQSVGRIVHYQSHGTPNGEYLSEPRAAIIAAVGEGGSCSLVVFNPEGLYFSKVPFSETPLPGHWSWPPRAAGETVMVPRHRLEHLESVCQEALDLLSQRWVP